MHTGRKRPGETGLHTEAPRFAAGKTSRAADCVLSFLLTSLGIFGTVWAFVSSFSLSVLPLTLSLYLFVFLVAFAAAFSLRKAGYVLLPLYAILYGAVLWQEQKSVAQGFAVTANSVITVYSDRLNYAMQKFPVGAKAAEQPWLCTMFLLFCVFLLCGFVGWAVFRFKSFWLTFFLTAPFLLLAFMITITPNLTAMLMLLVCWATLGLIRLQRRGGTGFVRRRGIYRAGNGGSAARTGLMLMPCVALCLAIILAAFPQGSYRRSGLADSLRTGLTDSFTQESFFGGSKSLAGNTIRVDLRNANGVHFTGKTVLRVKADGQYPLYLKNFAAGFYTGSDWQLYPDSDYQEINRELGGMNVQNMLHTFETLLGQQNDAALKPYYLQMKDVAAAKQCIYAPYNLITGPSDITGVKFINDGFIRSGSLLGTGSYSFYAYGFPVQNIQTVPESVALSFLLADKGQSELNDYLQGYRPFTSILNSGNIAGYYKEAAPQNLLDRITDPGELAFVKEEQAYREFMYDKYTQLPDSTRAGVLKLLMKDRQLRGFFEGQGSGSYGTYSLQITREYSNPYQIVNAVKEYLGRNFYYTLSPGAAPRDQDFALYFLTQSHKGYCVHFATAAAVMLRAMGVPARYAEGYIVTPDDYKTAGSDGWADIPDSRAHSWVEVYYPGVGWEPVEMTPGFHVETSQTQENNPQNQPPASSSPQQGAAVSSGPSSGPAPSSSASSEAETPVPSSAPQGTESAGDMDLAARPALFLLLAAVLLVFVIVVRREIELMLREKRFSQKDTGRAALCIYAYLKKLEPFGGKIGEEAERTALKARFSRNPVTEEEREAMRASAVSLATGIYGRLPKARRFAFKYLFGLI